GSVCIDECRTFRSAILQWPLNFRIERTPNPLGSLLTLCSYSRGYHAWVRSPIHLRGCPKFWNHLQLLLRCCRHRLTKPDFSFKKVLDKSLYRQGFPFF